MHAVVIIPYLPPSNGDHSVLAWTLKGYTNQQLSGNDSMEVQIGVDGTGDEVAVDQFTKKTGFPISVQRYPHMGAASVRNALARQVREDAGLLIFGNADARPDYDMVAQHIQAMASLPPKSLVLGSAPWERLDPTVIDVLIDQMPMIFSYCHMSPHTWYPFRIAYSLNLSVRREDFLACGGFHDQIRPIFYEDLAFACRLLGPEHKGVWHEPAARVLHRHPMTFDQYLDREELLGQMAPVLARVCPEAFAVLMANRKVEEIAADFQAKIAVGMSTYRSLYSRLKDKFSLPEKSLGEGQVRTREIAMLHQLHIPVKLMAFRLGFLRGLELVDDVHWQSRKPRGSWREMIASS